jgi:hypothetical protein
LELEKKAKNETRLVDKQFEMEEKKMENDHELAKKQQTLDHELQKDQHEFDKGLKEKKQIDDQKIKRAQVKMKPKKGTPGQGRPKNSKDSSKRKPRTVNPRTSAQIQIWATDAQKRISELVGPIYLKSVGKKNLRQISDEQSQAFELQKFATLAAISPFQEISDEQILNLFNAENLAIDTEVYNLYQRAAKSFDDPSADNLRQLQVISYTKAQRRKNVQNSG